jgi:hypothetical protein
MAFLWVLKGKFEMNVYLKYDHGSNNVDENYVALAFLYLSNILPCEWFSYYTTKCNY